MLNLILKEMKKNYTNLEMLILSIKKIVKGTVPFFGTKS